MDKDTVVTRRALADTPARIALRRQLELDLEHVRDCPECTRAGGRKTGRCDTGWQLAKAVARAQYAADMTDMPDPVHAGQGELW